MWLCDSVMGTVFGWNTGFVRYGAKLPVWIWEHSLLGSPCTSWCRSYVRTPTEIGTIGQMTDSWGLLKNVWNLSVP